MTHIKTKRLRKFSSVRQNLTAFVCREGSKRSRVEPGIFEAQTSVHTVGGEFKRHLFDIPLHAQATILDREAVREVGGNGPEAISASAQSCPS